MNWCMACDFTSFLSSISMTLRRRVGDNAKLCMQKKIRLNRFPPPAGLEPGTTRSISKPIEQLGLREIERVRRGKEVGGLMSITKT